MIELYPNFLNQDLSQINILLEKYDIRFENNVDYTIGKFDNDRLIATASTYKNIIKCVAIDEIYQASEIFNELISNVINKIYENGYEDIFIYTKPIYERSFGSLGFKKIESVDEDLVFMEKSSFGINYFLDNLKNERIDGDIVSSIVVNANPFTLGHRYLIDYALKNSNFVHIFILSEDVSFFKTKDRINMLKAGVSDLTNVKVHESGSYIISASTFPSYFIKEDRSVTKIHAKLDAKIFKKYISKALGIDIRFVGSEPLSEKTNIYNETLNEVFNDPSNKDGPSLRILDRKKLDGEVISASKVRFLINEGKFDKTKPLLPASTYEYIKNNKLY